MWRRRRVGRGEAVPHVRGQLQPRKQTGYGMWAHVGTQAKPGSPRVPRATARHRPPAPSLSSRRRHSAASASAAAAAAARERTCNPTTPVTGSLPRSHPLAELLTERSQVAAAQGLPNTPTPSTSGPLALAGPRKHVVILVLIYLARKPLLMRTTSRANPTPSLPAPPLPA